MTYLGTLRMRSVILRWGWWSVLAGLMLRTTPPCHHSVSGSQDLGIRPINTAAVPILTRIDKMEVQKQAWRYWMRSWNTQTWLTHLSRILPVLVVMDPEEVLVGSYHVLGFLQLPVEWDTATMSLTSTTRSSTTTSLATTPTPGMREQSCSAVRAEALAADVGSVRVEAAGGVSVGGNLTVSIIAERRLVQRNTHMIAHCLLHSLVLTIDKTELLIDFMSLPWVWRDHPELLSSPQPRTQGWIQSCWSCSRHTRLAPLDQPRREADHEPGLRGMEAVRDWRCPRYSWRRPRQCWPG